MCEQILIKKKEENVIGALFWKFGVTVIRWKLKLIYKNKNKNKIRSDIGLKKLLQYAFLGI